MALSRACVGLAALVAALLALSSPADADIRMPSTRPGLFYVFMSGQIVVINADSGTTVKSIRKFNDAAAKFPNTCPGNPLQGTWNGVALGNMGQTIFASASFSAQGPLRQPGLKDAVVVVNATTQEVEAIIDIDGVPAAMTPVPQDGTVWVHADSQGALSIFNINPDYTVEQRNLGAPSNNIGSGHLLAPVGMGGKGYLTNTGASGVYVYDVFDKTVNGFINLPKFVTSHHPWDVEKTKVYCPATSEAVYAPASRRVFVACTRATAASGGKVTTGPEPGVVEIQIDTDTPVDQWDVKADKLYITPDEFLVLALDTATPVITFIQPKPGINSDQTFSDLWTATIPLPAGSQPDSIVFFPQGKYCVGVVSLLKSPLTAIIDFNIVIPCGADCDEATMKKAVTYVKSGVQILKGTTNSAITTRPVAAGHHFFCVDAAFNASLFCYDFTNPLKSKYYRNMKDIQQIIFVEGEFNGDEALLPIYTQGHGVNTTFSCTTAAPLA